MWTGGPGRLRRLLRRDLDGSAWQVYARAQERGKPVTGTAVEGRGAGVALELDHGVRGFIRRQDLPRSSQRRDPSALVGSKLTGLVVAIHPDARGVLVSPRELARAKAKRALERGVRVRARIKAANHGGLLLELFDLDGFVPRSELPAGDAAHHRRLVGRRWRGYVITVNARGLILSAYGPRARRRRTAPDGEEVQPSDQRPSSRSASAISSDGVTSKASASRRMFVRLGLRSPRSMPPT